MNLTFLRQNSSCPDTPHNIVFSFCIAIRVCRVALSLSSNSCVLFSIPFLYHAKSHRIVRRGMILFNCFVSPHFSSFNVFCTWHAVLAVNFFCELGFFLPLCVLVVPCLGSQLEFSGTGMLDLGYFCFENEN